jgi:dienelactone hydrolase
MRRLVVVVVAIFAGCGGSATISATAPRPLLDSPVTVRVGGLDAGERVQLRAEARDAVGKRWASTTPVQADGSGRADLGTHPMRFLEAMQARDKLAWWVLPHPELHVRLTLRRGDETLASTTVTRTTVAPGVQRRSVTDEGLVGTLFVPPGDGPHPAVLLFGGSEGGDGTRALGGLLASHGIEVLTLAYFRAPGLPPRLERVPLEYFDRALDWLRRRPGVDRVAIAGISRGGEAALLVAATFPHDVDRVAALVPGAYVYPAFPDPGHAAWTLHRRAVPLQRIRVERIPGPILAVGAGDDAIWPSADFTHDIARYHHDRTDVVLEYPDAGHLAGGAVPYEPRGDHYELGGTPRADADAVADLFPRLVRFLGGA